jgi:cytochrome c peroxidase
MRYALRFAGVLMLTGAVSLLAGCAESKPERAADTAPADSAPADMAPAGMAPSDMAPAETAADPEPKATAAVSEPMDEQAAATAAGGGAPLSASSGKVMLGSAELTAGIPGQGPLKLAEIKAWLDDPRNHEIVEFELPLGLATGAGQVEGVDKNPLTRAKIELGRQLYFDPRLSADHRISCASCHDPDEGFARHTQFGVGIGEQTGNRNSPVSYNRILRGAQFWDGRAKSLEDQAVGPIANPIEMGNTHEACVASLQGIPGYKLQFEKIFGRLDIDAVGEALASFERTLVTGPTPFDYHEQLKPLQALDPDDIKDDVELSARYEKALADAEAHPLSASALRGRDLYFSDKAGCSACHVGANLTDEQYHNIGIGMDTENPDIGRAEVTKDRKDYGAFKTPTLRNVALSAPYMHDGSIGTLEEVVEWYAKGGHPNPALSEKIKKLDLSDQDKKDLVEFLKQGLTGEVTRVVRHRLPE